MSLSLSTSRSKKQKGQGLVEYALILTLVGIVVIAAAMMLGPKIGTIFSSVNSSLAGLSSGNGSGGGAAVEPTAAPNPGICYLRWTGKQWVHWYDNTPEVPGPCP